MDTAEARKEFRQAPSLREGQDVHWRLEECGVWECISIKISRRAHSCLVPGTVLVLETLGGNVNRTAVSRTQTYGLTQKQQVHWQLRGRLIMRPRYSRASEDGAPTSCRQEK